MSAVLSDIQGGERLPASEPGGGSPRPRVARRALRGRPGDPVWARSALIALLAVTGALYMWDLGASGWANGFYSAAVQAASRSWKAFFFGSFDASNFITVDKSPAALWVMDLSARLFGVNPWSILVPNALEGVATVGVVYATVRRWFPAGAGLLAGAAVALTPVAALMFRFNNPDAFLVLLLSVAAYATVRALESGKRRWVILAGAAVGFGFLAKMLEALLVVPALAATVLVAGPGSLWRRVRQTLYGAGALVVSAGWWVAAVQLTPAADRPYIGGSQDNNLLNLIFGYNGFGRLTGNESGSVGGAPAGASGGARVSPWGITGTTRLFGADMGTQISWLLPTALILLVAGFVFTRRGSRTDRARAALLLWGGWLVVSGAVFSFGKGIIHPYYTVELAPALGAVLGVGAHAAWSRRRQWAGRAVLASAVAAGAVWSVILLDRAPAWLPALRPAVLGMGFAAVAGLLVWPLFGRWMRGATGLLAVCAVMAGSAAFAVDTAATPHSGAIPSAGPATAGATALGPGGPAFRRGGFPGAAGGFPGFPRGAGFAGPAGPGSGAGRLHGFPGPGFSPGAGGPAGAGPGPGAGGGAGGGLLDASRPSSALVRYLEDGAPRYKWMAATVGSNEAAGYQLATGEPVMAIGGFNGTDPAPTLSQFERLAAAGDIHYFIEGGRFGGPGTSSNSREIANWVVSNYKSVTIGGVTVFDLDPRGA